MENATDNAADKATDNGKTSELAELGSIIKAFCDAREWDQFHSPKDVAIGLVTESAELLDLFRFKTPEQCLDVVRTRREAVGDELADVLYWVIRFAQMNGFDLVDIVKSKMVKNELKYPVEKSRGKNTKYNEG